MILSNSMVQEKQNMAIQQIKGNQFGNSKIQENQNGILFSNQRIKEKLYQPNIKSTSRLRLNYNFISKKQDLPLISPKQQKSKVDSRNSRNSVNTSPRNSRKQKEVHNSSLKTKVQITNDQQKRNFYSTQYLQLNKTQSINQIKNQQKESQRKARYLNSKRIKTNKKKRQMAFKENFQKILQNKSPHKKQKKDIKDSQYNPPPFIKELQTIINKSMPVTIDNTKVYISALKARIKKGKHRKKYIRLMNEPNQKTVNNLRCQVLYNFPKLMIYKNQKQNDNLNQEYDLILKPLFKQSQDLKDSNQQRNR